MIYEAIVTSAPRGLQAGRTGFTTVLRTRGMHPELNARLEAASGYRHVYPQGDPRNPQIRTHVVVQTPIGPVSVLSRIVDAGNDYSGRSNKLAHHVALDAADVASRVKSSPAAVLLQLERAAVLQRAWQGEPREQPAGPVVPAIPVEPGPCPAWTRAAGDAGWAGFIADRALAKQPTWIIAPPGVDLVELYAEALALVNYQQRWGVTFTTYALTAGDALWLGTQEGSPEAQAARTQSRIAVVDLVQRPPLTATSPLIAAARGAGPVPWKRDAAPAGTAAVAAPPGAGMQPAHPPGAAAPSALPAGSRPPPMAGRPPALGESALPPPAGPLVPDVLMNAEIYGEPPSERGTLLVYGTIIALLAVVVVSVLLIKNVRDPLVALVLGEGNDGAGAATDDGPQPQPRPGALPAAKPNSDTLGPATSPAKVTPDFAALAEAEAAKAQEQADVVRDMDVESQTVKTSLRSLVKPLDHAKKLLDELKKSPGAAGAAVTQSLATAQELKTQIEGTIRRADAHRAVVAAATVAAKQAARAARGHLKSAQGELQAIGQRLEEAQKAGDPNAEIETLDAARDKTQTVVDKATVAVAKADEASKEASTKEAHYLAWDGYLAEPRTVLAQVENRIADLTQQVADLSKAFPDLKQRLEQARHMPLEGIDAGDLAPQRRQICHVGRAQVNITMPAMAYRPGPENLDMQLACVPPAQQPPTQQPPAANPTTWDIRYGSRIPERQLPLATARIDEAGDLVVELEAQNNDNFAARSALACMVIVLENALERGATTHVQLAKPIEMGPIEIKKFLDAQNQTTFPHPLIAQDLERRMPAGLPLHWIKVDLVGRCGKLVGDVRESVRPFAERDAGGFLKPDSMAWSIPWTWHDKPVIETEFVLADSGFKSSVRVTKATLAPPWNSIERLRFPTSKSDAFTGLPTVTQLKAQTKAVAAPVMQPVAVAVANEYEQAGRELNKTAVKRCADIAGTAGSGLSLDAWTEKLRAELAGTEGYRKWVADTHPAPAPLPQKPEPTPEQQANHAAKQAVHAAARKAEPKYVDEYWKQLQPRLPAEKLAAKDFEQWTEALLCRWIEKVRDVKAGKAEVRKLLEEGLGYTFPEGDAPSALDKQKQCPDATLTGSIYAEFPDYKLRAVLVTFQDRPAPAAAPRPTDSP